jgi:hypothetical protein
MAVAISQEEALRRLFSNRRLTIETLLEIENKERQLVPMKLNPIQANALESSTGRDIHVKPGQVGATSLWAGDFLIDNITINGTVSVIISYDEFSAQRLLLKAKKYHQSLERKIPTIPKLDHKSSTELSFVDSRTGFYSTYYIFSARSYVLGRGETIHNLLLDEYAFWPVGTHEQIFASAVQRVPLKLGTKIVVQSTANGEDNPFHEMYSAAKEGYSLGAGRSKSVYKPHFYPWFIHPDYIMYSDDPFCLDGDDHDPLPNLNDEEIQLMKKLTQTYGFSDHISLAKLRWRRYKQVEMRSLHRTGETVFIFNQEFPEDDETCFLTAGNQAYSTDIIEQKIRTCYPAPTTKAFNNPKTGASAEAQIWDAPAVGVPYVIGIDPGKGKASESVAMVWHFEEGYQDKEGKEHPPILKHVATLSGWYDEWEMAEYVKPLGHYYNTAVLAPEDNLDIVSHVRDYPALYYREDTRTGKFIRAIGWQTNSSTKPYMLTELNRHMEDVECHDQRFWSQCKNIRRDPTMKYGISVVGADDYHDAGVIAICCRSAQSIAVGYAGNTGDNGGWNDKWGK